MKRIEIVLSSVILAIAIGIAGQVNAQSEYFGDWPAGSSPKDVGKLLAENWVKRDFEFQSGKRQVLIYTSSRG